MKFVTLDRSPTTDDNLAAGYFPGCICYDSANELIWILADADAGEWYDLNPCQPRNNFAASDPPTTDENYTKGWTVGSRWANTVDEWTCTDPSLGIWKRVT